jgi:putative nucleotidyltransferase with HDIG domain
MQLFKEEANKILEEASNVNPGKWVSHSINVAKIAERLAEKLNLDREKAYVYGLMHDIGRREGVTGIRHTLDGYNFLKQLRI